MSKKFKRKDQPKIQRTLPPDNPPNKSAPLVDNDNGNGKRKFAGGNGNRKNGKLTPKQAKFVDEYLVDLNATQAAIRAGYSKRTADVIGILNLGKLSIANAIQERRDELKANTQMSQQWVLERYKRLVDYDLSDFFDDEGNLKPLSEIPPAALYAVTGFKSVNSRVVNEKANGDVRKAYTLLQDLKLTDKKTALDSIGKHLGMFELDNSQRRPLLPIQINVTLED
jgi:phage terminase small subunit